MSYERSVPALGAGFITTNGVVTIDDSAYSSTNISTLYETNFEVAAQSFPVGTVLPFAVLTGLPNSAATGVWLECDGTAFNTTTYPALFALLSSGNLPDLRERHARGASSGFGEGGADRVTLASGTAPQHNHASTGSTYSHNHDTNDLYVSGMGAVDTNTNGGAVLVNSHSFFNPTASTVTPTITITGEASAGSGNAHNNLQPSITVGFFVRASLGT